MPGDARRQRFSGHLSRVGAKLINTSIISYVADHFRYKNDSKGGMVIGGNWAAEHATAST